MKDILTDIIAHKRQEVAMQKQVVKPDQLREQAEIAMFDPAPRRSLKRALMASSTGIIAEFKRRSPSRGWIAQQAHAEVIAPAYERAGAAALSILTDEYFFGGTLSDLRKARPLVDIPILRKDFIVDEYQLLQSRVVGADAVLLIAACLTIDECATLATQAHRLGLEVLLEVHDAGELDYIAATDADVVGVNNRHLGSFVTDITLSHHLAEELMATRCECFISESGISDADTITALRGLDYNGFLIGETFMRTADPADTLRSFIAAVEASERG